MIQRSVCYLLSASLLIVPVSNSAQTEEAIALQVSEMKEPRQRASRSIRRSNLKPVYQYIPPVEEMPETSRDLIGLSELNTSTDIDKLIHSPLGEELLSTIVSSLVRPEGQPNSIIPEFLKDPKLLWEGDNKALNFREEKQHYRQEKGTPLPAHGNNKNFKEKSSKSLTTVLIISPALLPSEEEYEADEWNFRDPRITSQHQVIRLNVNKDVHELLTILSFVQPREVQRHSSMRSKQPRSYSQRPAEHFKLGARYNAYYPTPVTSYYKEDYYEYPQEGYLEEIKEQEYDISDYDYQDDIRFTESDFSAANLGRIAAHQYNQVKFFWDLFHHGWPIWLEK